MKISHKWLKEIIDINKTAEEVGNDLTMVGLELDKLTKTGIGDANVVSVEIKSIEKHPEADKLFVTKVDTGSSGEKQIITNVAGLQAGQKMLAALEGAKLATGLEIKNTKLKGIESEGMFVGWEELGINQKSESLFFIDNDTPNGTNYDKIIPFNDTIIEIELNANRGDCLGMIGAAREVKAIYGGSIKELETNYSTIDKKVNELFSVEINTPNCHRYCGGIILDVKIKPSPYWMQLKLIKAGIRPINNVVDITNYILLECNQPLHAFDMDKIKNKKIIVRNAYENEKITTLDDIDRELKKDDILITDVDGGHCIGGVMGGQISEVTDNTKNIFLEAAFFKPENIRMTSRRLGLISESSYRFERGVDKERTDWALKRALYLFDKLGVGKVCSGMIDVYPGKTEKKTVKTSTGWINNKLGTELSGEKIKEILTRLDFVVETKNDDLAITVPGWRNDVSIREDIAEEVARIYGYNNINHTHIPSQFCAVRTPVQSFEKSLRELLYKIGCDEVINFSFVGGSLFDKMLLPKDHYLRKIIELDIPLTEDLAGMRNALIPGMIKTAAFNYNRQTKGLRLFEIGNVSTESGKEFPIEEKRFSILLGGYKRTKDYTTHDSFYDFYDIKGALECVLDFYKVNAEFKESNEVFLHPFLQAKVYINNKEAGVIGKLHPLVCESFDIDIDVFVAEISAAILFENTDNEIIYKDVPRFPSSSRDLALVVDKSINAAQIINTVKKSNVDILQNVNVFDIYHGENIEEGKYSIAIAMEFNKIVSTLTDKEVDDAVKIILENLKKECKANIR